MAVNLFFKHAVRKDLPSSLTRRNHMVIAHGLLGNCNNWNTSSDMLLKYAGPEAHSASDSTFPFVTDVFQVDMRNHGNSPHTPTHRTAQLATDLETFVKTTPLLNATPQDRTLLVGHSMGGIAVMHSLIRRANESYYLDQMVPSSAEEDEIRDTMTVVNEDPQSINELFGSNRRKLFGKPDLTPELAMSSPRINGAIIVDIPPMQLGREDKLGSVRDIVDVMRKLDLSTIRTTKECDEALKRGGVADPHMRMFLMTNIAFDQSSPAKELTHARWKCNIEALHNDLNSILIPDNDPRTTNGMRKVADVPVLFVFGGISEYYQSLPRVERLIDKYFDGSCVTIKVLEGCNHYPHYQAPKRYVELVAPFIRKVFE